MFTTPPLEEAEKLCDRIAIMDHGRILQTGSVRELAKVVGDRDVITLRGGFSAEQLKECLKGAPVDVLGVGEQSATLSLNGDHFGLASLVERFGKAGIELVDVSVQKPTLESVFLKLTGRELRD